MSQTPDPPDLRPEGIESTWHRHHERQATALFIGTSVVVAVTVGAMRISGWSGGVLDNRIEPLFWAGAILAGAGIVLFALAAMPAGTDHVRAISRIRRLLCVGLVLFVSGPILCVAGVFGDYWI